MEYPPDRRTRWWQRWAVVESTPAVDVHWIVSFHTFRVYASWACGRRIADLVANGNRHIYTCVMSTDTGAVRQAVRTKRIQRL